MALVIGTEVRTKKAKKALKDLAKTGDISFKKIQKSGKKANKGLSGSFASLKKAFLPLIATGGILTLSKQMIDLASANEESRGRFAVVFKEIEGGAEIVDALADSMGRSRLEFNKAIGGLGDILKPLGFAQKEAFELSKKMTALAIDVASFTNAQDADVLHAFSSALTGERESLKTYGIVISEADVKAEAFRSGIAKQGATLTKTQKALATTNLLFKNTIDAQGEIGRASCRERV